MWCAPSSVVTAPRPFGPLSVSTRPPASKVSRQVAMSIRAVRSPEVRLTWCSSRATTTVVAVGLSSNAGVRGRAPARTGAP